MVSRLPERLKARFQDHSGDERHPLGQHRRMRRGGHGLVEQLVAVRAPGPWRNLLRHRIEGFVNGFHVPVAAPGRRQLGKLDLERICGTPPREGSWRHGDPLATSPWPNPGPARPARLPRPRVYEALYGTPFPENVQVAENLFDRGLIDAVVPPSQLSDVVDRALGILVTDSPPCPAPEPPLGCRSGWRNTGAWAASSARDYRAGYSASLLWLTSGSQRGTLGGSRCSTRQGRYRPGR